MVDKKTALEIASSLRQRARELSDIVARLKIEADILDTPDLPDLPEFSRASHSS